MNFSQSSMYSWGQTPFHNNKINSLLSRLENLYVLKNRSFNFSSKLYWWFLLKHKRLHSFNSSLKFPYSGKQLQEFDSTSLTFFIIVSISKFIFMNSFRSIINKIWLWPCRKPCTIKKLWYVRYMFCNFFAIFTNSCNLFFYWNCKGYVFFSVFS